MSEPLTLPPAIFLMGPTASGKTGLAVALAQQLPVELISVDSALVYQDMDIGSAKPDAATLKLAPHHLLNVISPLQSYSAAHFRHDALQLMADITARGRIPLLVGGTMLYFKALQDGLNNLPQADADLRQRLDEEAAVLGWPAMHARLATLDPETAARLKPTDSQRIQRALEVCELSGGPMSALFVDDNGSSFPYRLLKLALVPSDRSVLHARIAERFDLMLQQGLIAEVEHLRQKYPALHLGLPSMRCVGYRQVWEFLDQQIDHATMREKGIVATRQLAKRQLTWLRGMQDTVEMDCLASDIEVKVLSAINQFLAEGT